MPLPSTACHTCKLRRIKCDGAKPTCQRCAKSRRVCLEADTLKHAAFSIHLENSFASGVSKRPRGPRSSLTLLRPHFDLQSKALGYYLNDHLNSLPEVSATSGCLPECLSSWKLATRTSSMVDLALSSLALAVFAHIYKSHSAAQQAASRYKTLIRTTSESIGQLISRAYDESNIDACLLTVLLMDRFEGAVNSWEECGFTHSLSSASNWAHHDGAIAILKLWYDHPLHGRPSYIVQQARRGLIKSALLKDIPISDWMVDGTVFGEEGTDLQFDHVLAHSANLHYESTVVEQTYDQQLSKAVAMNKEAQRLDKALQDWAATLPEAWSYQAHSLVDLGSWPRDHFYSPVVHIYPKLGYTLVWGQYFALRILINSARISSLDWLQPDSESQRLECISNIKAMADNLAATLPFCLGRLEKDTLAPGSDDISIKFNKDERVKPSQASMMIWPSMVTLKTKEVSAEQRIWFRAELASLGSILGKIVGNQSLPTPASKEWQSLEAARLTTHGVPS